MINGKEIIVSSVSTIAMEFSSARLRIVVFGHSHQSCFLPNGGCVVGNGIADV